MNYERPNIAKMSGYVPGEQSADPDIIKLNANENPYPPVEGIMNALRDFDPAKLRLYPSAICPPFRKLAAKIHDLEPENIMLTNAGDELLKLITYTFAEPGKALASTDPSFTYYPVLAAVQDCPFVTIPLEEDWSIPTDFAKQANDAGAQIAFIVSPHAPTGLLRPLEQIRAIAIEFNGILVLDEAYVDFVDPVLNYSSRSLIDEFDNLIILRTFSKGYSLAGMRIGYGMAQASLIKPMIEKTRDIYNVDAVAQALAIAALENRSEVEKSWLKVIKQRAWLIDDLAELGFESLESQTNFILTTVPDNFPLDAAGIYEALKVQGIYIRYFKQEPLTDKLRITVGTPEQNETLINALRKLKQS